MVHQDQDETRIQLFRLFTVKAFMGLQQVVEQRVAFRTKVEVDVECHCMSSQAAAMALQSRSALAISSPVGAIQRAMTCWSGRTR